MDQLVSKRAYAKLKEWPPSYVMRLGQQGRLVMRDGFVDVEATDKLLAETADPAHAENAAGPTFIQAKTKREWHEAQMAELKHQKQIGRLVDAEDIKREYFAIARAVRDALLALPDRLAPTVAAEGDARRVHELLSAEIEQVLNGLASEFTGGSTPSPSPAT